MKFTAKDIAFSGITAAIYIVLTLFVAPWSFGPVQFRLSETLNALSIFNKRYIFVLTIGVFLANFLASAFGFGLGPVDWFWGALQTLLMTTMSYIIAKNIKSLALKLVVPPIITSLMMWMIALELSVWFPQISGSTGFVLSWLYLAISEFIVVSIGSIIVYFLYNKTKIFKNVIITHN
jgi:uncharacterized membrane protein